MCRLNETETIKVLINKNNFTTKLHLIIEKSNKSDKYFDYTHKDYTKTTNVYGYIRNIKFCHIKKLRSQLKIL